MTARYPYALAAMLVASACVTGCDRAQARASEPAAAAAESAAAAAAPAGNPQAERKRHVEEMRRAAAKNTHEGKRLAHVQRRLRALESRARAALPPGATPEQVRAELEGNPRKYPAYRELVLAQAEHKSAVENNFSQAQKSIRAYHTQRNGADGRAQGATSAVK